MKSLLPQEAVPLNTSVFHNMLEILPGYVFWKNAHSVYAGCNENFAQLVGLRSANEVIGKTDADLPWQLGNDSIARFQQGDPAVLEKGLIRNREEILVLSDGRRMCASVSQAAHNATGQVVGMVGYFTDLTPLKQLEEALRVSQQATIAATAQQSMIDCVTRMSHDICSPLAIISIHLRSLERDLPEAKRHSMQDAVQQIKSIAHQVLVQYRTQSTPLLFPPIPLLPLLEAAILAKKTEHLERPGIHIELVLSPEVAALSIAVNPTDLRRALSNLLNNAIESLPEERGKITMTVASTPTNDHIQITVQDTGCGIPPDILEQIKTTGGTYGKAGGSGIGVQSTRQFFQRSGGTFDIHSTLGKGTTVLVSLPGVAVSENTPTGTTS